MNTNQIQIDPEPLKGVMAYRYEDQMYAGVSISPSGSESYYPIGPKIELREYPVIEFTPKGFWIPDWRQSFLNTGSGNRWIGNFWHKKFACLSKEEALKSFKARKRRQISLYRSKLSIAEKALLEADYVVI